MQRAWNVFKSDMLFIWHLNAKFKIIIFYFVKSKLVKWICPFASIHRICANDVSMRLHMLKHNAEQTLWCWGRRRDQQRPHLERQNYQWRRKKENISTLPWKCHAEAQRLTTTARSNTGDYMLLLLLWRAQTKPTDAFLTFANDINAYFSLVITTCLTLMWRLTRG